VGGGSRERVEGAPLDDEPEEGLARRAGQATERRAGGRQGVGWSGDTGDLGKGFISFKIRYPADFVGTPEKMALALYPPDTTQPISTAPSFILHPDVPLGDYTFGEITEYTNIAIDMLGLDYGDYTLTVNIYVEGGSYPIPTSGKDYIGLQNVTIDADTITLETPFELTFMQL